MHTYLGQSLCASPSITVSSGHDELRRLLQIFDGFELFLLLSGSIAAGAIATAGYEVSKQLVDTGTLSFENLTAAYLQDLGLAYASYTFVSTAVAVIVSTAVVQREQLEIAAGAIAHIRYLARGLITANLIGAQAASSASQSCISQEEVEGSLTAIAGVSNANLGILPYDQALSQAQQEQNEQCPALP